MRSLDLPLDLEGSGFRDKVALALARVPQAELDELVARMVRQAAAGEERSAHVLARLADQAFGRVPAAEPTASDEAETWTDMSRDERAAWASRAMPHAELDAYLGDRWPNASPLASA